MRVHHCHTLLLLTVMALCGCYFGAGPSAGVSLKKRSVVVGWEGAVTGIAGLAGGQAFRHHDDRWRTVSWGAFAVEWPVLVDHDATAVPLLRGYLGGAEGDEGGFVAGVGAGTLLRPRGICSNAEYSFDVSVSIRRIAGDTQLALTTRAAFYPITPGCASP